jgi:RNA polymerase sigma factor (sigma-70 family)
LAAVPSIGRASAVDRRPATPGAELTRDLYERYHRQIFSYCLHQLSSREEAEDATQTTFMNAFRGLQRGVVPELESAWLFKIANNVILTRRRSTYRRRRVETPGDLDAIQDLLPSPQRDADELIRLTEALGEMPEQQRKALLLREWQGLSYREIGDRLGLTQAAVETLLFRARHSLANGLTEPPRPARKSKKLRGRLRNGIDVGSLLAGAKALLTGGAAVKVAATAAAVATTAVVADSPPRQHFKPEPAAPKVSHVTAPVRAPQRTQVTSAARVVVPATARYVVWQVPAGAPPRAARHAARAHTAAPPAARPAAPVTVADPLEQPRPEAVQPGQPRLEAAQAAPVALPPLPAAEPAFEPEAAPEPAAAAKPGPEPEPVLPPAAVQAQPPAEPPVAVPVPIPAKPALLHAAPAPDERGDGDWSGKGRRTDQQAPQSVAVVTPPAPPVEPSPPIPVAQPAPVEPPVATVAGPAATLPTEETAVRAGDDGNHYRHAHGSDWSGTTGR